MPLRDIIDRLRREHVPSETPAGLHAELGELIVHVGAACHESARERMTEVLRAARDQLQELAVGGRRR